MTSPGINHFLNSPAVQQTQYAVYYLDAPVSIEGGHRVVRGEQRLVITTTLWYYTINCVEKTDEAAKHRP